MTRSTQARNHNVIRFYTGTERVIRIDPLVVFPELPKGGEVRLDQGIRQSDAQRDKTISVPIQRRMKGLLVHYSYTESAVLACPR